MRNNLTNEDGLNQQLRVIKKFTALLVLLFIITLTIFVSGLHKIKTSTEKSLQANLVLIEQTRESTKEIMLYLDDEKSTESKDNKHIERINALLIDHDQKLNILQEYTSQLYGIQQSYAYIP